MTRGTTPTLSFCLPIAASTITKLSIMIRQFSGPQIEKTLDDVVKDGHIITATLTEEETLQFRPSRSVEIQLRVGVGDTRMASQIWTVPVERILKDGAL